MQISTIFGSKVYEFEKNAKKSKEKNADGGRLEVRRRFQKIMQA